MKKFGLVFGALCLVALGAGGAFVGILGTDNAQATAAEFGAGVADTIENADEKIKEVRFDACRKRYLKNTECLQTFSQKVCTNEVNKACDPSNPNYHGEVPGPAMVVLKEGGQ